jgi:ketosteroid isomerase-like protein
MEDWKNEILLTELNFAQMVAEEGIPKAFLYYADENAVLMRNNQLIIGKGAIKNLYVSIEKDPNISLTWKADFVDVSSSGDLGYTYGEYTYSFKDENGNTQSEKGIFHTVWKRQENGDWRFVWD